MNHQKIIEGMGCELSIPWAENHHAKLRQARWINRLEDSIIDVFVKGKDVHISVHRLSSWSTPHDLYCPAFASRLFERLEMAGLKFQPKQQGLTR
jgi:hypothetical protein